MRFQAIPVVSLVLFGSALVCAGVPAYRAPVEPINSFQARDVRFETHDGYVIDARISYPRALNGNAPAVLIIPGSGKTEMDLPISGEFTFDGKVHKIYLSIADALNEAGFIVMRYNKRGVISKPGQLPTVDNETFSTVTVSNLVKDALAGVRVLERDGKVDHSKIILLGHSEGTMIAPRVAEQYENTAALVLLGFMGRNLAESLYAQNVERTIDIINKFVDKNHDGRITRKEIEAYPELSQKNPRFSELYLPFDEIRRDNSESISIQEIRAYRISDFDKAKRTLSEGPLGKWYQEHLKLDPNYLRVPKFKKSILIINGAEDDQCPLENVYLAEKELKAANHPDYHIEIFAGLGHAFSPNTGTDGILTTLGPIDESVLKYLRKWLQKRFLSDLQSRSN